MFICSITSRGLNQLPHDSRYDVLTTTLKKGCSIRRVEMVYKNCGDPRVQHCIHSSFFPANGWSNSEVF